MSSNIFLNMKAEDDMVVCPETISISTRQVMPFLLDMSYKDIKHGVKPSVIIEALKLTTEECLEKLRSPTRKYKIGTKKDTFSRCPEAIIFQNFKKGVSYTTPLTIKNQKTVPKNIQIQFEASTYFNLSMDSKKNHQTRIAPGMSYTVYITFLPNNAMRDYIRDVKIIGDDETFTVPVYALGPRPMVMMPDKIVFPATLVKVQSTATVVVKNTGIVQLPFVHTVEKPFSCDIHRAIIPAKGILELKYNCYPTTKGFNYGQLKTYFKNELCVSTDLECEVASARIELERQLVTFEDVYMGLSKRNTLVLHNTSDYTFNFCWKMYDEAEEEVEFKKMNELIKEMRDYQLPQYKNLEFLKILDGDAHADIYQRILEDETKELLVNQKDTFKFNSTSFDIVPKFGKVLPKSDFEFSIIFSPQQNICYECAGYLDIEGTERRVKVTLLGYGIGPPVMLCVKRLNASQIYLTDKHQYELSIKNKGVIAATVTYQSSTADWGGVIECIPESLVLGPDTTRAFVIVFYSEVQGDFLETLDFIVEESGDHLQCIFTGSVICPLLKCVPEELDFGTVSIGLKHTRELDLVNDSRVVICFDIEIDKKLKDLLTVTPLSGAVDPHSRIQLTVTLTCGFISSLKTNIHLMMWKSKQYTKEIPFKCIISCPSVICNPETITIKFCFLNCEYYRTITLENETDLSGYIEYKPTKKPFEAIRCIPHQSKIYMNAREIVNINLKIIVTALGLHELPVHFAVIGSMPQKLCTICCNGQGPVISYQPDEVDFGQIELLKKCTKSLKLFNDSPISAKIKVNQRKLKSPFHIEETQFELSPEKSVDINITALFTNAGKVKETIQLEISDSDVFTIKIFGEGSGTSIVCEPPIFPKLDLGVILTYKDFTQEVVMTNKSIHLHKLLFSIRPTVKSLRVDEEHRKTQIFNIEPHFVELQPEQAAKVTIQCFSKKPKLSEEVYYCHGIIGKSVQPQVIMKFFISAEFKDPQVDFSRTLFNFNINVHGSETSGTTLDTITFNNMTGVPLQAVLTIDEGFSIVEGNLRSQRIAEDLLCDVVFAKDIEYHPSIKEKRRRKQRGRIIVEYQNHPKSDIINLYGEVMYPTIKLIPNIVDFHCIPLGSTSYMTILIQNISAMVVTFKWLWLEKSITINDLNPLKAKSKMFKIDYVQRNILMEYINAEKKILTDATNSSIRADESEILIIPDNESVIMTYTTEKYLEEMRKVLYPILDPFQETPKEDLNNVTPKQFEEHDIMKMFALEPSEGFLHPNEYTVVTMGFSPPPNTEVMATAVCKVFGGEEEQLVVMGKSAKISYILDKKSVNLGNQVFCEICTDMLTLFNNGLCCFNFKVVVEETLNKQAEMLDITPKVGMVSPNSSVKFKIDYFPGFPGKFEKPFTLELGYLEPVTIKVHGYAVVSQIFLRVPRLDMELSLNDCYKALAWITPEYLETVHNNDNDNADVTKDQPLDPTGFLEENDWTYISYDEPCPSLMDINLAMERIVALNHILKNKNTLKDHTYAKGKDKIQHIPNFFPPFYCVDFGYVVRDMPVCYTVRIYNYGPINAEVKLLEDNKSALLEKEFKIEFRDKVMAPGDTVELFVLFSPTKRRCKELFTKLEDVFRLTVTHGPVISVKLKAEVTLPIVSVSRDPLYFDKVYCGDVLRKRKILLNDGNVLCKWFVSVSKPTRKGQPLDFFVVPSAGELEAGMSTYINIYFVPTMTKKIKRTLQIDTEGNDETILIDLYGEGLGTLLKIEPKELKFSPTLSFFDNTTYFTIENLSAIPVEVFLPTLDKAAEDEKMIIQIYLKYKNLKQVFIPFKMAGHKLPDFFRKTYEDLVEKLRLKMIYSQLSEFTEVSVSNVERPKSLQKRIDIPDPLAKYTPEELKTLLNEYISAEGFENEFTTRATTHLSVDSTDCIEIVEPDPKAVSESTEKSGVLIIFHGAVTTDYYRAANQVGIALSFPVYSIDRLIIELLVESSHPYAQEIVERIHERFEAVASWDTELINNLENEDNKYDKLLNEITCILTIKPKKGGSKKVFTKEKSSKASSEKSQNKGREKSVTITDCFLNILPDNLVELLRIKLTLFPFLIIESLHSIFLPKENLSLYTILRAAGAVQHIQLIILSFSMDNYVANETAKLYAANPDVYPGDKSPTSAKSRSPEVESPKGKTDQKSSDKKSKGSPQQKKNIRTVELTRIIQNLGKPLKVELEKFEQLQREILHIAEHWDRRSGSLRKPYVDKTSSSKKDTTAKESSRTIKSSNKRPSLNQLTEEEIPVSTDAGLHLWIILNGSNDRSIDFCEMIRNCILKDTELTNILEEIRKSMEPVFEESETVFSVVSKPSTRHNFISSTFILRNFRGKDSIETIRSRSKSSGSETKPKKRRNSKSSKKSADSKTAVVTDVSRVKVLGEKDLDHELLTRTVLEPEESVKYEVTFAPVKCGKFSQSYTIEDSKSKIHYNVICNAVCEYPRIDFRPEIMFSKTLDDYRDKASYDHFVYIKDQKIFDFGSILVDSKGKSPVYSSDVILKNPTSSRCEVTIRLSNDNFYTEPNDLVIRPKSEEKIKICIKPTEVGTITSAIFLSVKNSPRVEDFIVACTPCKLEFSISPKLVGFDKVPLSYKAKRIVKMTNSSPINLRWEFAERDWNNGIFDLSAESGYIGLYSVSEIVFHFKPKEELFFPRKQLQIRVYDVNKPDDPCYIDNIVIHADSVEYNLEVDSLIDYGEVKGGIDTKYTFPIYNKGKCEVSMMFHLINNPLQQQNFVREFFKIHPQVLTIGSLKTENISVTFHPTCNLSVDNMLLFVVNIVESLQSGHTVKSYQVKTSATVFMPSYIMCPHSDMIFGQLQLFGSKKMILEIFNNGRFDFSFVLQSYTKFLEGALGTGKKGKKEKGEKFLEDTKASKIEKANTKHKMDSETINTTSKLSKGTPNSKIDKKKIKAACLEVDGFVLTPSSGVVEPNERFEIFVEFTPQEIKEYNEEIIFNVAQIEDIQKKKVFTFKGFGCEPKLNLKDYENVFIEQYTVTDMDEFIPPKNIDSYCVFVLSEVALYFKLVCFNTIKTIQLHIKNIGFVPANMTAKVDDGKGVFSVSPVNRKIDPYSACILEVTFKPDSLEVINSVLEILYNATTDNKLSVQLCGQACLPQIKLLNPIPENNVAFLNFGPICVGREKKEKISFKNVGPIKCNVILEISDGVTVFELVPDKNTTDKLNVQIEEYIIDMKDNLLVNLLPGETAEFEVIYKPVIQQCIPTTLSLHIIYNPFEVNKIILKANSFDDDVIVDELNAIKLDSDEFANTTLPNDTIGYLLDFGHRELNKLSKLSFFLRNRSETNIFKFRITCNCVTFIPEVGHLKPKAFKEILVLFQSSAPVLKVKEQININLTKIEYLNPNEDPLSWDDRQKFVYYVVDHESHISQEFSQSSFGPIGSSGSFNINDVAIDGKCMTTSSITTAEGKPSEEESEEKEMIEEGTEPEITTVSGFFKIIPLYLTVAADYSKYACEVHNISFLDLYINETSVKQVKVENTGTVAINIKWDLIYKNASLSTQRSSSSNNMLMLGYKTAAPLQSVSATSLFSREDSTLDIRNYYPFTINPDKCVIEPGQTGSFDVMFSPESTEEFKVILRSVIDALDPCYEEMCINVTGKALPVPFYLEYEDGHSTHRDLLIKFESVGNGNESTRNVFLVNPNDEPMSFEIMPNYQKEFTCFICETPTGQIKSRKKAQITFTFTPHTLGKFKAIYVLKIPEENVTTNILLEGECRPAKVYFTESSIVLKATVPKIKTVKSVALVNDEAFPLSFKFIKKSLFDETQHEKLEIFPIVGKIKPKSSTDIRITFITSNIVVIKFHVKCLVEKLKSPLILNVSASCIEIESVVSFTDKSGSVVGLKKDAVNVIDLGQTYKGRKEIISFEVSNSGQTGMFYLWKFDSKAIGHLFKISVDAERGFVKKGECAKMNLCLEALRLGQIKQFKINLNIMYGPSYTIHLNVISDKPIYSFSFYEYNFGCCFLQNGQTKYYSTTLSFRNLDANPILLENLFENTTYLTVDFTSSNVPPGGSRNIPVAFHPQTVDVYQTKISFLLGNFEQTIPIAGEGVEVNLELCLPKDRFINFGEVLIDTPKKYRVCVVNNTSARMDVHFTSYENLVNLQKKTSKLEKIDMKMPVLPPPVDDVKKTKGDQKKDKSTDTKVDKQVDKKIGIKEKKQKEQEKEIENQKNITELLKHDEEDRKELLKSFIIIPNMFIDIPSHGKGQFEIIFQPNKRYSFEEKIYFEIQDHFEPLCIIKGVGVSPEFSLDRTDILFPGVIINCSRTELITLRNTGDVIGSFNWHIMDRRNIFDIEPKQGFVLPNHDMKIKVTFLPKDTKCEFRVKAKCVIKEYKEPLYLLLKGNSIKVPEPKETIVFNCNVRENAVQAVSITNTSSEVWIINTEISSNNFSAPREITALPFADTQIQITYCPKFMTPSKPDEGILFIKLSSGGGMKYKLIGKAGPPSLKKKLEKEVYCKQNNFVTLPIENWMKVKQSFNVITEVISPVTTKTLYQLLGMTSIQLDGKQTKNFKWGVYLVNDVPIDFRVTFKNMETGEYEFYEIGYKVLPVQQKDKISFQTRVREPITRHILLENPVDVPITFALECAERNLVFDKSLTLNPYTTTKVDITYTPLREESISTVLNVRCEELGLYPYALKLQSDPPKLENSIIFMSELGEKAIKNIIFKNIFDKVVEFSYKFDNEEFYMERCAAIPIGESSKIAITFDPSALGPLRSQLFLNSAVAGEYIYPLEGEGLSPTPKGPFTVRLNFPTTIEFKNPFNEERTFKFQTQPALFHIEINEDVMAPKKSIKILVSVRTTDAELPSGPVTGKLTIYSANLPELQWTYYLLFNQS